MPDIKRSLLARPLYITLAAVLIAAILTLTGYWHSGSGMNQLYFALAFPVVFGVMCGLMYRRRFYAWLAGMILGFLSGTVSALPLLTSGAFEGEFYISSATLVFFAVLGFSLGAAGEFVRLLHFVAHGGSIIKYPDLPPEPEPPLRPRS